MENRILIIRIVSEFEPKLSSWMVTTDFTCPVERCEEKLSFLEKSIICYRFHTLKKINKRHLQTTLAGFSNYHSSSPVQHFEQKVA